MEGLRLEYDGSIRNANGTLLQFRYGEDGMDGACVEHQSLPVKLDNKTFARKFKLDLEDRTTLSKALPPNLVDDLSADAEALSELQAEWEQLAKDRDFLRVTFPRGEADVVLPLNLKRLVWNAQRLFHIDTREPTDLAPTEVVCGVRDLLKKLIVVQGDDPMSQVAQENATMLTCCLLRTGLSAKQVLVEHRLSKKAFQWLLGEIEHRVLLSLAQPGEMVGALAAQSVGEPATQVGLWGNTVKAWGNFSPKKKGACYSAKNKTKTNPVALCTASRPLTSAHVVFSR
jgi:DNA-directed RNA polymerase II subunit RPB1